MKFLHLRSLASSWLLMGLLACGGGSNLPAPSPLPPAPPVMPPAAATTFTNPLLSSGPDPWVSYKDGFYYYTSTTGGDITLRKTAKMSELRGALTKVVWTPPSNGTNSRDIWAPELHFLDGKWYIYYTAGPGNCCGGQRSWVLENSSADPTVGAWTEKGRIYSADADFWAIDATVLEQGGKRYLLWSGHPSAGNEEQRIYISAMKNPWTLDGPRVELSRPEFGWEKIGPLAVNEGPQVLQHGGSTFIIYSASHCTTDEYSLGQLRLKDAAADPLDPKSWTKSDKPVFTKNPAAGAYGPGHNGFFKSKDGSQDWIIYHANSSPGQGCGVARNPRMQQFFWKADGSPDFGPPATISVELPRPAGE